MKALITAFALLSFVAASTVPMMAQAQAQTQTQPAKPAKKKATTHKKAAKKTTHKKAAKKMKKPNQA
ncbi:MAG TPA: hypothetical protein VLV85_08375 [Stellaceae bacterium]|jgi:hypothetical protein|nr:hypothetical protein [Stellaceae bacterium]